MKKELETISNHWHVVGTLKIDSSEWTQNVHVGIDAQTMQAALEIVVKIHPTIRFISCIHRGPFHARENLIPGNYTPHSIQGGIGTIVDNKTTYAPQG